MQDEINEKVVAFSIKSKADRRNAAKAMKAMLAKKSSRTKKSPHGKSRP